MLETEFGGMEDVLTELYVTTGDPEHLRLARLFDHRAVFDPLARGEDPLDGLHANTQIPKAIGAARDCEVTGEPRYCAVAETFWQRVALHRSYAIGGHSEDEHFSPVTHLSRHLGESTAETCNTYNMLKLSRRLFLRDADPARIEFYERGLFNHILASQDPATGMVTYYVALAPGAWRTYSTPEDSFWCCVGTGMENPARYGEAIYARQGDALLVNLFLASELTWREKGLTVRQETRFPDEDRTRLVLRLEKPARFALRLRHPAWAKDGLAVSVNGQALAIDSRPGAYATVEREWHDGDAVEVRVPMGLRFEPMPDDPLRGAFLYGPVVLAADLGTEGLDAPARYGPMAPEVRAEERPPVPTLVAGSPAEALARLKPAGSPLAFRTEGLGRPRDFELRPFFRLTDRRLLGLLRRPDRGRLGRAPRARRGRGRAAVRRPRRPHRGRGHGRRSGRGDGSRPRGDALRGLLVRGPSLPVRARRRLLRLRAEAPAVRPRRPARDLLGRRVAPPPLRGARRGRGRRDAVALRRPPGRGLPGGVPDTREAPPGPRPRARDVPAGARQLDGRRLRRAGRPAS